MKDEDVYHIGVWKDGHGGFNTSRIIKSKIPHRFFLRFVKVQEKTGPMSPDFVIYFNPDK